MEKKERNGNGVIISVIILFTLVFALIVMAFCLASFVNRGKPIEYYCQQETQEWWNENFSQDNTLAAYSISTVAEQEAENGEIIGTCMIVFYNQQKGGTGIREVTALLEIKYKRSNVINPELIEDKNISSVDIKILSM